MWRLLQLKRKSVERNSKANDAISEYMLKKIDDAIEALNKNEDELVKITGELLSRQLTKEEKDKLEKNYKSYLLSNETLKGII